MVPPKYRGLLVQLMLGRWAFPKCLVPGTRGSVSSPCAGEGALGINFLVFFSFFKPSHII
jgi:hypothetical protein